MSRSACISTEDASVRARKRLQMQNARRTLEARLAGGKGGKPRAMRAALVSTLAAPTETAAAARTAKAVKNFMLKIIMSSTAG